MLLFSILKPCFLAFKMPILAIHMLLFGVLNAKSVLRNFIKVKCHFWHLDTITLLFKRRRLTFMKWTPGSFGSKKIKIGQMPKTP